MDIRKIIITIIAIICVFAVGYGIYFQLFETKAVKPKNEVINENTTNNTDVQTTSDAIEFDKLFDNKINYQEYSIRDEKRIEQTKDIVYTVYSLHEIYEGKYDINVNIPIINIENDKAINIDKEINAIFLEKVNSIISNSSKENVQKTIYTVDYTAYINENILSLVIKATVKEGNNVQRLIIKAYTYNLSTNEQIPLGSMLNIKGKNVKDVEEKTKRVVQEAIGKTENLTALGYNVYERDINSTIYKVENSDNYFLGPNGVIYIIYAYGNSNYTSERDVVVVE